MFYIINEELLRQAMEFGRAYIGRGKVADYIPELGKADPNGLGISVHTADGAKHRLGDWQQRFTIQSISKVINLAAALEYCGFEEIFSRTGMEPSGSAFNSMYKLTDSPDIPSNPMINSGALTVVSLILPLGFDKLLTLSRRLCMDDGITLNEQVFRSEWDHSSRNRSLAYLLHSKGVITADVEGTLELYTRLCSLDVTADSLAGLGLVLANGGVHPETGERLLSQETVRIVLTTMLTCGMYDGSGEFAFRVGLPSKSGVGGGIVSVVRGSMGIGVYNPSLDPRGNSVAGQKMLEHLSMHEGLHILG